MAASNGTVIGVFGGTTILDAFTNPSQLDILQVLSVGGRVVYNLSAAGVASTNPASPTKAAGGSYVALYQQNGSDSLADAFTNPQHLDLLQVVSPNGGAVKFYVDYLGAVHTS